MADITQPQVSDAIAQLVSCGVFSVDRQMQILSWNRFMQYHSGFSAEDVIGTQTGRSSSSTWSSRT